MFFAQETIFLPHNIWLRSPIEMALMDFFPVSINYFVRNWYVVDVLKKVLILPIRLPIHVFIFPKSILQNGNVFSEWLSAAIQRHSPFKSFRISLLSNIEIWIKGNYCQEIFVLLLHKLAAQKLHCTKARGQLNVANNILEVRSMHKQKWSQKLHQKIMDRKLASESGN